jgi:PAS domain S-box-containing protein
VDISHAVAEAILSMRSVAIIAVDREGIFHFWNSGAGRLFGYSPDEAISRSLDFIIPEGRFSWRMRARGRNFWTLHGGGVHPIRSRSVLM